MRERLASIAAFTLICAAGLLAAFWLRFTNAPPTSGEYLSRLGAGAGFVAPGSLAFGGVRFECGRRPTVLAPGFEDYAAAFPGFLIVNPERFPKLTLIVQRWAWAHECGHQFVGRDELAADCYAIATGRAQGWLDAAGMDAICAFISRAPGGSNHPPGVQRCAVMRKCFARARVGLEAP
ncbi:MAG: hypothetical protein NW215_02800 [Hyphomicrobiales bacterium]|nr:hypothetical protein [Hyphomicrobiales bacterium]